MLLCKYAQSCGYMPHALGPNKGTRSSSIPLTELSMLIRASGGAEGIVNGMDVSEWSPKVDKFLDVNFDEETVEMGKSVAKESLQVQPINCDADTLEYATSKPTNMEWIILAPGGSTEC